VSFAYLGPSSPVSLRGHWPSFVSRGGWGWSVWGCSLSFGRSSSFVGGRLRCLGGRGERVVVHCHWRRALCRGCLRRHRWVVVWWLVEEQLSHVVTFA
jgi:hypothetical protein